MRIDINDIRQPAIALHGLANADNAYTIYYDETNNIRRLHARSDGLNVREPDCFVIGGVAYQGSARSLSLDDLRFDLRVQPNAREIKLKHVATGKFLDLLRAPRMEIFLQWLSEQQLFIHYFVLDPLYWSVVDIVDSILTEAGEPMLMGINPQLKNDLYTILRDDYDGTVDVFQRYTYPDVGREKRRAFIAELRQLLEHRSNLLAPASHMMLKGILQIAEKLDALPYLEDETPNVLIEGFAPFYMERICLLKNAVHVFDVEEVVKRYLGDIQFSDGGREFRNFSFAVSHEQAGIQVADIVTGLLGKFFSFLCWSTDAELAAARLALDEQQLRNLGLLKGLLDQSVDENEASAHTVMSIRDCRQAAYFLRPLAKPLP
jgi:hypothetical protein